MFKKFIAFTLAEVMLVAGITAVVAAMTVPNMKKSFDKKARISKAKAVMAKLDNAMQNVDIQKAYRGNSSLDDRALGLLNELENYLQFRIVCGKQTASNYCFSKDRVIDTTSTSISDTLINGSSKIVTAILNDGTEIAIGVPVNPGTDFLGIPEYNAFIVVDVDGAKNGPQTRGEDIFLFVVSGNGLTFHTSSIEKDILN